MDGRNRAILKYIIKSHGEELRRLGNTITEIGGLAEKVNLAEPRGVIAPSLQV